MDENMDEDNKTVPFTTWMIVYTPSENRVANYNHVNNIHPTNQFVAIDSVSNFQKYSDFAIENKYNTPEYIDVKSSTEWNLVLEDDTLIHIPMLLNEVQPMLHAATKFGSKYIQLYTHSRYRTEQSNRGKVGKNLYKMMTQWGTCAYFIHKDAIPKMREIYPVNQNIDFVYNSLIISLKSLCWLTPYVKTIGETDGCSRDKTANMGSIIMCRNAPRQFSIETAYAEFDEFLRATVVDNSTI